ncbi:MAG TPA: AMP-binding protein [Acidimicrobiales bacterium]|nr:AMP-binding protein [Acidimicrobiales bacterium]
MTDPPSPPPGAPPAGSSPPGAPAAAPAGAPAWAAHLPAGVAPGDVDLLARRTLPAAWADRWRARPDRPVIRPPGGTWLTGADLLARTAAVAGRLAAAGLVPGDRVVMAGGPSADLVVAHCAALRAGLVVVPVNPAYSERELGVIVADAEPRAALLDDGRLRAWARTLGPGVVVAGTDVALPGPAAGGGPPLDATGPADPALLPYTSGTTGTPKGALLTHGNLLASTEALLLAWRWTGDDRLIHCLPLFHMHGLGVGLHGTLLAGASAVLLPRFEPEAVLAAAADPDLGATLFFGVPTMYARLAGAPGVERLGGLRLCVSGSAPLSAGLHHRLAEATGQRVVERYGMTETVMLVSNPVDGERRPGTVGLPLPGVEVRLDHRGATGTGEILVRGPNVFGGYWRRPDATAEAIVDGWFRTGDIGTFDGDGYLSIVGRAKELIITGGYNVYPREIEDLLRSHASVVDVAVVGTPSEEWGEVVTAYVEPGPGFDAGALTAWAAPQLAPYKRPRVVHAVDALPRNPMGKVVRDRLRPPD